MAGLFDRTKYVINEGEPSRLPGLTLWACVYAVGRGVASAARVANKLDEQMEQPLRQVDKDDLMVILTNATTGVATQRLDYMLRLQAVLIAAETGLIESEAVFRSELGI